MDKRIKLPKAILDQFQTDPRIIIKYNPAGLWPLGPEMLRNAEFMKKVASDKEFQKNFEVVIMQK